MTIEMVDTVILGGGITGLSVAYHLQSKDYVVLEKSNRAGGLAGTIKKGPFEFDHTGHFLHLRDPYATELIKRLLADNLKEHKRAAYIYQAGKYIPYPYQANLFHANADIARECMEGIRILQEQIDKPDCYENFRDWVLCNFGAGFYKHFFQPYNEKLFGTTLEQLTTDWMGMFIPRPNLAEIEAGCMGNQDKDKSFGYNAKFYYPKTGGIQSLADAMVKDKDLQVSTNCTVEEVNMAGKYVVYNDPSAVMRKRVYYNHLVSTLPLPTLVSLIEDLGHYDQSRTDYLKATTVYNLNLAINRPNIGEGRHWCYYPEAKYSFYRIGFCNSFNPTAGPAGTSSIAVEVALDGPRYDYRPLDQQIETDLRNCGLLKPEDKIIETCPIVINPAYVIFDHNRNQAVEELTYRLKKESIHLAGRFGAWKYTFMESDLLNGKQVAEELQSRFLPTD